MGSSRTLLSHKSVEFVAPLTTDAAPPTDSFPRAIDVDFGVTLDARRAQNRRNRFLRNRRNC
jgi:hypothetical protein